MGKIVGVVYRSVCSPIPQHLQRLSAILNELAIDRFELTIRGQDRNETGYSVNCRAQTSLGLTQRLFRPLALRQIEHEGDALVAAFFEHRDADEHGNAAAIFAKILLLERLKASG